MFSPDEGWQLHQTQGFLKLAKEQDKRDQDLGIV